MKWAAIVLVSAVLVIPAAAQLRGIPPSVTSIGGSHSPGIPPSVTSIGNSHFNAPNFCCRTSLFPNQFQFGRRSGFRFHHGLARGFAFPAIVAVPVAVPVPIVPVVYESEDELQEAADPPQQSTPRVRRPVHSEESDAEEAPEDTDRYGEHYLDSRERRDARARASEAQKREEEQKTDERKTANGSKGTEPSKAEAAEAKPAPPPPPPAPATVLVYRDGHRSEIRDYAIVGTTLYDIGEYTTKKIALADLDLDATTKANDDRGVSFQLPKKRGH
jgi:hypothetical protein